VPPVTKNLTAITISFEYFYLNVLINECNYKKTKTFIKVSIPPFIMDNVKKAILDYVKQKVNFYNEAQHISKGKIPELNPFDSKEGKTLLNIYAGYKFLEPILDDVNKTLDALTISAKEYCMMQKVFAETNYFENVQIIGIGPVDCPRFAKDLYCKKTDDIPNVVLGCNLNQLAEIKNYPDLLKILGSLEDPQNSDPAIYKNILTDRGNCCRYFYKDEPKQKVLWLDISVPIFPIR
jgi:hypothetical protein